MNEGLSLHCAIRQVVRDWPEVRKHPLAAARAFDRFDQLVIRPAKRAPARQAALLRKFSLFCVKRLTRPGVRCG
jgi:hypothetical protein